jgi:hypothetical protein
MKTIHRTDAQKKNDHASDKSIFAHKKANRMLFAAGLGYPLSATKGPSTREAT